jgi:hypothetical protein
MRPPPAPEAVVIGLLLVALRSPDAEAGVVEDLSVAEMAVQAEVVVEARVAAVHSAWDSGRARIMTTVTLDVLEYLAGSGPERLVVRQVGGRVGEIEHVVPGAPRFAAGQWVVAFLVRPDPAPADEWVVLGMAAGLYAASHDASTGEVVLARDLAGLDRVRLAPGPRPIARVARPLLLRDLAAEVRRARGAGGGR